MSRTPEEIVQQIADDYAKYADDEREGPNDAYARAADELLSWPGVQAAIRQAKAEAIREASEYGGQGFDLNPTISTLNGQNAFYWYDYLAQQHQYWKSRLAVLARKYDV